MDVTTFVLALVISCLTAVAGIIVGREVLERERRRGADTLPPARLVESDAVQYDPVAGERWVREARVAALRIFGEHGEVTSDCVWRECPPPPTVDGRLMSNVLSRADWEIVGYRRSARGRNAARKIAVWRLKGVEAA